MELLIQTFPLEGKTLYYVQCPACKRDRILNSGANVSNTISEETFRKLCGCICHAGDTNAKKEEKPKKAAAKRSSKALTAVVDGKEMTVKEIADMYGLSQSTVRQRIHAGKTGEELIASTKRNAKKLN
ncbi:DUF3797 domain-containing protein [Ectobacillus panaciterrae]|uniref:DUF3797 domain-containing protein n=1 Tax=Ectobacillus panaciterrae TaxID=363872 RepID=UPI0004267ABC|nr:DUF3797 domain-containing protein [Ectobacillus panaciterrae]